MKSTLSAASFTILIVDDHELVRLGVRALLQSLSSLSDPVVNVLEAGSLAEALALYEDHKHKIDLVMLDLALPDTHGLSGLTTFYGNYPDARVVVLSGVGDTPSARKELAQRALAAGARAFLPKTANLQEVASFIRACGLVGGDALDSLPRRLKDSFQPGKSLLEQASKTLAARHLPVFRLILEGMNNKEIAEMLHLSEGTVKNYVSTILLRLGIRSRAQLISRLR
ncbi:response regulator [Variovorax sp. W2I14]|uniref:response regulator transcription factor n=1 Tax=Variovorax sp. W2I14 TaxID=3042290 RepID=UPI003D1F6C17